MRKKILIVENDSAVQDVIEIVLEDDGYIVEVSIDGKCIVEDKGVYPDIYLIDIPPSGGNGLDLCRQIKASASTQAIPVIIMSVDMNVESLAKVAGANAYLAKPFEIATLKSTFELCANNPS